VQAEEKEVTLETLGRGGAVEQFNAELERALADCLDPNADPKAARAVVLTVKLKPTEDRTAASIEYKVAAKLAGMKPQGGVVFIGKERRDGETVAVAYDRIQYEAMPQAASVHPIRPPAAS
jgi:hypothetical protein